MNIQTQKGISGNLSHVDPLTSAQTDSHLLRFCGMPSEHPHRILTFQVILGDLYRYLEFGGLEGSHLESLTPKVFKYLEALNTFIEFVGFPDDCWGSFQVAVEEGDAFALADECRKAIDGLRRMRGWDWLTFQLKLYKRDVLGL